MHQTVANIKIEYQQTTEEKKKKSNKLTGIIRRYIMQFNLVTKPNRYFVLGAFYSLFWFLYWLADSLYLVAPSTITLCGVCSIHLLYATSAFAYNDAVHFISSMQSVWRGTILCYIYLTIIISIKKKMNICRTNARKISPFADTEGTKHKYTRTPSGTRWQKWKTKNPKNLLLRILHFVVVSFVWSDLCAFGNIQQNSFSALTESNWRGCIDYAQVWCILLFLLFHRWYHMLYRRIVL